MSLAINPDEVRQVLLPDGWHVVAAESFDLDSYEYVGGTHYGDGFVLHGGGQSGICSKGFQFTDDHDAVIAGPLTAVLAVKRG